MKRTMKSVWVLAAGLSLVLAGCTGSNGGNDGEPDARDSVVGTYNVYVHTEYAEPPLTSTPLIVSKDGDGLKVEAVISVPELSAPVNLSFRLSELKEVSFEEDGEWQCSGLAFEIAEQPIAVPGVGNINFVGISMNDEVGPGLEGYAGYIANYTSDEGAWEFVLFGITGQVPGEGELWITLSTIELYEID